jgi:hypothetical protein
MTTRVTNTINGDVQLFDNSELANAHVQSEIIWFNSPNENKKGNGYDETDFIMEPVRYVICDKTENTARPYIAEDLSNTGDYDSAWIFNTKEDAQNVIDAYNWDWAFAEEI